MRYRRVFISKKWATTVPAAAMLHQHRYARGRSLDQDDAFMESSSKMEPDGGMAAMAKFDESLFDTATSEEAVQGKHFGPSWSQFSTIGRRANNLMMEGAVKVKTVQEMHDEKLAAKAELMKRNYETYEDFVRGELGQQHQRPQEDEEEVVNDQEHAEGRPHQASSTQKNSGDSCGDTARDAVVRAENVGDGYRMQQIDRSQERLRELSTTASNEVEGIRRADVDHADGDDFSDVPLPPFASVSPTSASPANASTDDDGRRDEEAAKGLTHSTDVANNTDQDVDDTLDEADAPVVPLRDPQQWTTADVVRWIAHVGRSSSSGDGDAGEGEAGAMDESMQQAFEMIRVDGAMLLNKVTPNTLFKKMRRWHMKRMLLIKKHRQTRNKSNDEDEDEDAMIAAMHEAVLQELAQEYESLVTPLLVQETIYLCYPYGRY